MKKLGEWLTLQEVCEELKVKRSTIDKWRRLGIAPQCLRLPSGAIRINREELNEWLTGQVAG